MKRWANQIYCGQKCAAVGERGTHLRSESAEYRVWSGVKERCTNPKKRNYRFYGGRGIKVCERWQSFENFLEDMGPRPSSRHTIERDNNDGDYEPGNCRWATRVEQTRNRKITKHVTFRGQILPLAEWCERLDVSYDRMKALLRKRTPEEAFAIVGAAS